LEAKEHEKTPSTESFWFRSDEVFGDDSKPTISTPWTKDPPNKNIKNISAWDPEEFQSDENHQIEKMAGQITKNESIHLYLDLPSMCVKCVPKFTPKNPTIFGTHFT